MIESVNASSNFEILKNQIFRSDSKEPTRIQNRNHVPDILTKNWHLSGQKYPFGYQSKNIEKPFQAPKSRI